MTRRLFLLNWTGELPRTYGWLAVLAVVVSALLLFGSLPGHVYAQSGINTPTSGATVSGDVPIIGTAVIDPFQRYELYYKLEPSGDDAYIYFDGGTNQVNNGQLAIWRTAMLAPGTYSIRLRVVKIDGNYGEFFATGLVVNQGAPPATTPTETPTSTEPTPTPIPTATFTPAPQPTPIVGQVTQPQVEGDVPLPTPTTAAAAVISGSASAGNVTGGDNADTLFETTSTSDAQEVTTSFTRELGEAVALNRLRSFFFTGMRVSAILILGSVILLAGRRIFSWVWTQYR